MRFKDNDLSTIQLLSSDSVNIRSINKILANLLNYDKIINVVDSASPTIWECKWYNDRNIPGYSAGQAVWYNTEYPPEFIKFNADKIYKYAKDNSYLKNKIQPYTEQQYELYYSILTGYEYNSYGGKLSPLFDIGQLSNTAQIKISKFDNNKEPLSNSNAWKDFFVSNSEQRYNEISVIFEDIIKSHLENYHLGSYQLSSSLSTYLYHNLENVEKYQKYHSHIYPLSDDGFDHVKIFVKKPSQQTFINSVEAFKNKAECWKVIGYNEMVNPNGQLLDSEKNNYYSMLSGCNNYLSSGIDNILANLNDHILTNIEFTGAINSLSPSRTSNYEDIKGRESLYDCTFDKIPLSTDVSSSISAYIDKYELEETYNTTNYMQTTYLFNKWFKLWKSGKLEHGGIIATKGKNIINIDFNWEYTIKGEKSLAPTYDYPTLKNSFYGQHETLNSLNHIFHDKTDNISLITRYTVSLTPITSILSSNIDGINSIDYSSQNQYGNYIQNEITELRNDGFSIVIDDDSTQYYSYHVIGYTTNG